MKIVSLFFLIFVVGCTSNHSEFGEAGTSEDLLNEIIDNMQARSINKDTIDWDDFRKQVFEVANIPPGDTTKFYGYNRHTINAIETALDMLNDEHSFYQTLQGSSIRGNGRTCTAPYPEVAEIPDHIGYLKVGSISAESYNAKGYSTVLQARIKNQDDKNISGWIIDLRGNTGGSMSLMLAGISSILGEGVTGYFIDPDGNETMHEIIENAFWIDGRSIHTLSQPMYQLINDSPKVAVLIDKRVMSSGEAVAISFKKRSSTKFFGTPTCGLSTVNRNSLLRNGGMLVLTVSTMADREKEMYGDAIKPDILVENPSDVVRKAIEWLSANKSH